ncbi:hypothetical protein COO91_07092 [Nostoc flagelliforme CCNUN1]|uniref:Uncharacterized protein n=1 Tax=Nostoc flagelliforme CCNUN1 TaxID=2038116 RepID=A0A2K8T024_9NOSO|nr:hypothetical protein COO91_07092 [Nostoc flagelliforme CCNUN1]
MWADPKSLTLLVQERDAYSKKLDNFFFESPLIDDPNGK